MTNTPQLPGQAAGRSPFVWLFLRFDGRIGREVYWLSIGLLWSMLFVTVGLMVEAVGQDQAASSAIFLGIGALWCELALLVKRQHDRGLPWYWCLLAFIPVLGAVWMVLAGLLPGDSGSNAYGRRADVPPD